MHEDIGAVRRSSLGARWGSSVLFALCIACGDDEGGDTMAGSSTGTEPVTGTETGSTTTTGVDPDTGSTGLPDTSSSSGEPTTTMGDDTSSGGESSSGEPVEEVFFPEVLAIMQEECFCHRSPMPAGMLDLGDDVAYDSLVNVPAPQAPDVNYVTPGDADGSYLYLKLLGEQQSVGGSGSRMPQGGVLPDEQILLVRNWILSGAQP